MKTIRVINFYNPKSSPPWRGEFRRHYTFGNWGGLLTNEENPKECDARDDAMKNKSWKNSF